jgi:hypothetical protein
VQALWAALNLGALAAVGVMSLPVADGSWKFGTPLARMQRENATSDSCAFRVGVVVTGVVVATGVEEATLATPGE